VGDFVRDTWRRYRRVFIGVSFAFGVIGVLMATLDVGRSVGIVLIVLAMPGMVSTRGGAAGAATGGG
jgi:hypothetical protein